MVDNLGVVGVAQSEEELDHLVGGSVHKLVYTLWVSEVVDGITYMYMHRYMHIQYSTILLAWSYSGYSLTSHTGEILQAACTVKCFIVYLPLL